MALIAAKSPHTGAQTQWDLSQYEQAASFTTTGAATVGSIRVWIKMFEGAFPPSFTWSIYADVAGTPAGSATFTATETTFATVDQGLDGGTIMYQVDFTVGAAVALDAATTYWLGLKIPAAFTNHCRPLIYNATFLGWGREFADAEFLYTWEELALEIYDDQAAVVADPNPVVNAAPYFTRKGWLVELTGTPDATTDYPMPASSISVRLKSGELTQFSAVIPRTAEAIAAITARPAGELQLSRVFGYPDGSTVTAVVTTVDIDAIDHAQGGLNQSISIRGTRNTTNTVPVTVDLGEATYRADSGGARRFRCAVDHNLNPGDTANINGESILVDSIVISANATGETMEIVE